MVTDKMLSYSKLNKDRAHTEITLLQIVLEVVNVEIVLCQHVLVLNWIARNEKNEKE
jgi:hypothetical protein